MLLLATPALLFASSPTVNQLIDRDLANQIWGNPQNYGLPAGQHPDANYFNHQIPDGMGARALGMGEAFTGIADDISAIWWNPAGLVHMPHNQVHWMGSDKLVNDMPWLGFAAADYMLDNRMVIALSYERPYHPVGRYPDLLAGSYPFTTDKWNGVGPVVVPGPGGTLVPFSSITDTKTQTFLANIYRYYINPPVQENDYVLTFATPLSADRNLSFGINVKYIHEDPTYMADGVLLDEEQGWGADIAFMYQLPLNEYGHQLSFALDLRDIAAQVKFGNSREVTIPSVANLGVAWQARDFFAHSKLNLDFDFNYINDPGLDFADNHRMSVGGEMWFFNEHVAPRLGYTVFFDQPSRIALGISFRYLIGMDYAYLVQAENENDGTHFFSLYYQWGGPHEEKPLPDVSATVDPPIFSPRLGEVATFTLSAAAKAGIDRWSLMIIDHNNNVVKTYQDRGTPPAQIQWAGEDKVYRPLPDGEYTFLFSATDNLGSSNSTPVQSIKIYTVPPKNVTKQDIDQLRQLIKSQQTVEETAEDKVSKDLHTELAALVKKKGSNQNLPDLAVAPPAPQYITGSAASLSGEAGTPDFGYPRVDYPSVSDVPFPRSGIQTGPNGAKSYQVVYNTNQIMPRYILSDIADLVRVAAKDVGDAVSSYDVSAKYGNKTLRVVAPTPLAQNLSRGFMTTDQLLQNPNVSVTLDGQPLSPNYR